MRPSWHVGAEIPYRHIWRRWSVDFGHRFGKGWVGASSFAEACVASLGGKALEARSCWVWPCGQCSAMCVVTSLMEPRCLADGGVCKPRRPHCRQFVVSTSALLVGFMGMSAVVLFCIVCVCVCPLVACGLVLGAGRSHARMVPNLMCCGRRALFVASVCLARWRQPGSQRQPIGW